MLERVQIRMARAALGWSARELADAAGVATNTVSRFEVGGDMRVDTLARLEKVLEKGGVVFIPRDAHGGPGVRLKR